MPVPHDTHLPSIQSLNNSVIILENSACSLLVQVFRHFIKSNFISKELKSHAWSKKKKKSVKYLIFTKEPAFLTPPKKDNQTITRFVNSKRRFKIEASGEFTVRALEKGGWVLLFREITLVQVCVLSVAVIQLWLQWRCAPFLKTPLVGNWHPCAEMSVIAVSEMAFSSDYWFL